ncbi:hypothetical protein FC093_13930 [Ilyomonas limi]|uniref:Uncharacterized protein n=1 Tax=Ilyomonas limi TaxID=2575867 RepID=A0A4U3L1N9_9BACT|nr:hypothetical protein [Ilyomonas limi]TKK67396.1 hypothetical protein FC093_13930 [Ilyomonas limi]
MPWRLEAMHQFIVDGVHPDQFITCSAAACPYSQLLQQAKHKSKAFHFYFLQQCTAAKDAKALKITVQTTQVAGISLLNTIVSHRCMLDSIVPDAAVRSMLQRLYDALDNMLLEFLEYLQQYYPAYFGTQCRLPAIMLSQYQVNLGNQLPVLETALLQTAADPVLVAMALKPVRAFINFSPPAGFTYGQAAYLQALVASLQEVAKNSTAHPQEAIITCLMQQNFNDWEFLNYLMNSLVQETAAKESLKEKADQWTFYLKKYEQLYDVCNPMHSNQPPVKAWLCSAIRGELNDINKKLQVPDNTAPFMPVAAAARGKILTGLSVNQLAVMSRLLVDSKIIQHSNQAELLKMFAVSLKTAKVDTISPDSLRAKYYSPDQAAITIVKEYLLQMLTQLKKY